MFHPAFFFTELHYHSAYLNLILFNLTVVTKAFLNFLINKVYILVVNRRWYNY